MIASVSVWASNMEENKSLKRIKSKKKKFRGVNRGLESVFELVYCLVLDWILFKILREGWEMIFKD